MGLGAVPGVGPSIGLSMSEVLRRTGFPGSGHEPFANVVGGEPVLAPGADRVRLEVAGLYCGADRFDADCGVLGGGLAVSQIVMASIHAARGICLKHFGGAPERAVSAMPVQLQITGVNYGDVFWQLEAD